MDKTYSHNEHCDNCGKMSSFSIPKGTTIERFMQDRLCGYCGCLLRDNKVKPTHDRDPYKDLKSYLDRNPSVRWKDNMQDCHHSQKVEQDIADKIRAQMMPGDGFPPDCQHYIEIIYRYDLRFSNL